MFGALFTLTNPFTLTRLPSPGLGLGLRLGYQAFLEANRMFGALFYPNPFIHPDPAALPCTPSPSRWNGISCTQHVPLKPQSGSVTRPTLTRSSRAVCQREWVGGGLRALQQLLCDQLLKQGLESLFLTTVSREYTF